MELIGTLTFSRPSWKPTSTRATDRETKGRAAYHAAKTSRAVVVTDVPLVNVGSTRPELEPSSWSDPS